MKFPSSNAYTTIIRVACVLVLGIIAVAGLWPFHAPRERVKWFENENGLRFGYHRTAISAAVSCKSSGQSGLPPVWREL